MKKLFAVGLMLAVLLGGTYAFFGHGMGFGPMGSQDLSDEVRFDMMSAMHNSDWEAYSALAEENGIELKGPGMNEESFALRAQMNQALEDGNYEEFSALREKMQEQQRAYMEENGIEAPQGRNGGMGGYGRGFEKGEFGGCPFADGE